MSDEFKRAKKPYDANPLADYSDDAVQAEMKRSQSQDKEITELARKLCDAEIKDAAKHLKFSCGEGDGLEHMILATAAIIAGMELQKGRDNRG